MQHVPDTMPSAVAHVSEYMTPGPFAVGPREPLANAARLMGKYGLHHLPVTAGGELVGIVSGRDVERFRTITGGLADDATVEQAMTREPYAASPDASLVEVVRAMAERRLGSAVIVDAGSVVGVFTATDALRVLASALETGLFGRGASSGAEARPKPGRRAHAR